MCLKESWRYWRRENGDTYEDSLTRHIYEVRLIKNRSRVRLWRMEWYTVLLARACLCVCVRACAVRRCVGCAYVLENRAASIFGVKVSRSRKCSGSIGQRPLRLKEGEEKLGPIPRGMEH